MDLRGISDFFWQSYNQDKAGTISYQGNIHIPLYSISQSQYFIITSSRTDLIYTHTCMYIKQDVMKALLPKKCRHFQMISPHSYISNAPDDLGNNILDLNLQLD